MPQVQIPERIFVAAQRRAVDSGYATVDDFISEVISQELDDTEMEIQAMFTPERLAHIDRAIAEIDAGKGLTFEQAEIELAKRKAEWIRNNPG